jgi:chromosomal replication initiator protein
MTKDTWGRVREELLLAVGKNNYANWIEPLELSALAKGVAS